MEKNNELRLAWDFVENTGKSIFLTGKAGTGKTTFLKAVKEHTHKRMVVVAPTGVAAINAGGSTIHSFFQIAPSLYIPGTKMEQKFTYSMKKRMILRTLDLLVIDEISMVRCDLLDAIDTVLRRFREHDKPFGGVQLMMIGDLQQLTPVVTPAEEPLLSQYYDTPYFFGSHALQAVDYVTIELTHVYRQQDDQFLTILNHVREGHPTADDLQKLNSRVVPNFHPKAEDGYIKLTTHNRLADNYNDSELRRLTTPTFSYTAQVEGDFPTQNYPTDFRLVLRVGAQVMFLKNDPDGRFYNGRIGHITYVDSNRILVLCPGDEKAIEVERSVWENTTYDIDDKGGQIEPRVVGSFSQYPLRLAWAITIHKSQGLTFDHAIIEAQSSFASGQVYVALSRCKTLQGLVLAAPISPKSVLNDSRVTDYVNRQHSEAQKSIERLPMLKEEYYLFLLEELFSFYPLLRAEGALDRVLQEFFYGKSELAELHHNALSVLRNDIIAVADKWTAVIRQTPDAHEGAFLERVKRSAAYFRQRLTELFEDLLRKTTYLDTTNKMVRHRLERAYAEVSDIWYAKCLVLKEISENGYTQQGYLKYKQEAVLAAMRQNDVSDTHSHHSSKKKQKINKPKIDTKKVTYDLFQSGQTIHEIALQRNLTDDTIFGHLAHYVLKGDLPLDRLVPLAHIDAIRRVGQRIGTENGMKPIKELCPPEITYSEIRLVMKSH